MRAKRTSVVSAHFTRSFGAHLRARRTKPLAAQSKLGFSVVAKKGVEL